MKIKICGMKNPENMNEIAKLQPNYFGFIFYKQSPRYYENSTIDLDKSIKRIGVFVNASHEEIKEKVIQYQLNYVQLQGEESPEFCTYLEDTLVKVIKSFPVDKEFNFSNLDNYMMACSFFHFDSKGDNKGGNGTAFDWEILKNYTGRKPYFISGGICPEDITKIEKFLFQNYSYKCYAIDINSKFEIEPGIKNSKLITPFLNYFNKR